MNPIVQGKQEAIARIRAAERELLALGVKRISLFGSFARGAVSPSSDVDLLVEFQPGHRTFDAFMDLHFFLEDLMGRRIELVTPRSLNRHIGPHILREAEDVLVAA